jgi:hypothetical protein
MDFFKCIVGRAVICALLWLAGPFGLAHSATTIEPQQGGPSAELGSEAKSLADGLYMSGVFTYLITNSSVTITLTQINNDSFTRTTGTLRLELWAVTTPPARAGAFSGYLLAVGPQYDPLAPRTYYSNLAFTAAVTPPPSGTYWLVLSLTEYNPSACGSVNPWCENNDSFNSFHTETFPIGSSPPPSISSALENPKSGSYQSGIGLISGWSCRGPITVTVDGVSISAPYGSPRADTASLCSGSSNNGFGLLVNYNNFGAGSHTAQLYVNGVASGSPSFFTVTVPSGEFMTGLSKSVTVPNFPSAGRTTTLIWQESQQNFAIQSVFP